MHLCEAGVPLPYIRDILGHVDLSTTEIYAGSPAGAQRLRRQPCTGPAKHRGDAWSSSVTASPVSQGLLEVLLDWLEDHATHQHLGLRKAAPAGPRDDIEDKAREAVRVLARAMNGVVAPVIELLERS